VEDETGDDDLIPNQTNKQTNTLVVTRQQTTHFTLKTELTRLPNQIFFFFFFPPSVQQPDMFLAIKEN
jgi:hypothetical protein